jgi:hypothetical protein
MYYPHSLNIGHLIVKPGWVSTEMTKNREVNYLTSSVNEEIKAIFNMMGFTNESYVQPKHLRMMLAIGIIPRPIYDLAIRYKRQ